MPNTGLPNSVKQVAITGLNQFVIAGDGQANTIGVQIANQVAPAPAAPTLTPGTTGGTIAAGSYQVELSLVNSYGEVIGSSASVTTTGSTGTITINAPTVAEGVYATGWNVYCQTGGAGGYWLQNSTPIPFLNGSGPSTYVLTAPPLTAGTAAPAAPGFVGTLSFSSSIDGFNYSALTLSSATSATAPGVFTGTFSGLVFIKVQATAWTSGMAVVSINSPSTF